MVGRTVNFRLLETERLANALNMECRVRPLARSQRREVPVGTNHATQQAIDEDAACSDPFAGIGDRRNFLDTGLLYGSSVPQALPVHTEGYSPAASGQVGLSRKSWLH